MKQRSTAPAALVICLCVSLSVLGEVQLPALFCDHMVFQAGMDVPVWGKADPGEAVTVTAAGKEVRTKADPSGAWKVYLPALSSGGPHVLTVRGKNTVTIKDVLVGEVWICSGQSNMQWPVSRAMNADAEIAQATYPEVRLFTVKRVVAEKPQHDTEGSWSLCSPERVGSFSAVGYFFGRELHRTLGVPVGLIHASWGGTPAEAWTSRDVLEAFGEFAPILSRWEERLKNYAQEAKTYEKRLEAWKKLAASARARGKRVPRRPRAPVYPTRHPHWPSGLYNGMIAPLVPYAIRGAIWYQGESNASRAYQYRTLFPAMICNWRDKWGQGDFPFLFVQLANFRARLSEPSESAWAELREAQDMALALPRTGMAVAIDIGEANNIHPKNKQEVGRRLALAAQGIAYGKDVVYSGPRYSWCTVEGNTVRIHFTHTGSGLICKGRKLVGFAVAGPDRKFVWASARIEGQSVVVWSEKIPKPVAVRYAWADNPECNLYNREGLPACPFRTDAYPGVTAGNK